MIDPCELRLGNYIHPTWMDTMSLVDTGSVRAIALSTSLITCVNSSGAHPYAFDPVRITDLWLEQFGFVFSGIWIFPDDPNIYITNEAEEWERNSTLRVFINGCSIGHIKYVHSLQNLYFAVTSKELLLKP